MIIVFQAKTLNLEKTFKRHRLYSFIWTFCTVFIFHVLYQIIICSIVSHSSPRELYKPSLMNFVRYTWYGIIFTLVCYQFTFASLCLRERFKLLNTKLVEISKLPVEQPINTLQNLNLIIKMHDQLCDGISLINSIFTVQVIIIYNSCLNVNKKKFICSSFLSPCFT